LQKIFEICRQTPHIKHWLATREYQIVKHFKEEDVPENLCLRVSALEVDGAIPKFWQWTSGVHKDKRHKGKECRAYTTNNECGSCRACWNRKVKQVSYKEH
jgi:ABC-type branched-subunit amino acid transport system ATPase component